MEAGHHAAQSMVPVTKAPQGYSSRCREFEPATRRTVAPVARQNPVGPGLCRHHNRNHPEVPGTAPGTGRSVLAAEDPRPGNGSQTVATTAVAEAPARDRRAADWGIRLDDHGLDPSLIESTYYLKIIIQRTDTNTFEMAVSVAICPPVRHAPRLERCCVHRRRPCRDASADPECRNRSFSRIPVEAID